MKHLVIGYANDRPDDGEIDTWICSDGRLLGRESVGYFTKAEAFARARTIGHRFPENTYVVVKVVKP